jgi:hypothetical protein
MHYIANRNMYVRISVITHYQGTEDFYEFIKSSNLNYVVGHPLQVINVGAIYFLIVTSL